MPRGLRRLDADRKQTGAAHGTMHVQQTAIAEREADLQRLRTRLTQLDGESAGVIKLVRSGIGSPDDP